MKIFIQQAKVIIPGNKWNGKKCDVLIEDGIIQAIDSKLKNDSDAIVISQDDLHLSLGWFDMRAHYCDPGTEYKENLLNGLDTAAKSGFTGVAVLPSTTPVIDSKADVQYLLNKSSNHLVDVHPIGAITQGMKGEALAEMFDMKLAGAKAFTDDKKALHRTDLVKLALQYGSNINSLIMLHAEDAFISKDGQMNEGAVSTLNALKGMPNLSEEMSIARNLHLNNYADGNLHISTVSTKEGVDLIRQAKANGQKISADVAAYNLSFTDDALSGYDSSLKVNPPIRTEADRKALIAGVIDGTIDVISSDNRPEDVEHKNCEFSIAEFGMVSQESFLHMIQNVGIEKSIASFTTKPRTILGLDIPEFDTNVEANLTLFSPSTSWLCNAASMQSQSKNTPFLNQELKGKVLATFANKAVEMF